jgi:hypothetical protein
VHQRHSRRRRVERVVASNAVVVASNAVFYVDEIPHGQDDCPKN